MKKNNNNSFNLLQEQSEVFAFSDNIIEGKGEAYGFELIWKGAYKSISGWASYGFSHTDRTFPHIMNGKSFLYDYDRPHSFKTVLNYQVTPKLSYSTSFIVQSGVPKSVENTLQFLYYYDPINNEVIYNPQFTTDYRNNARFPFTMNLDFGLQKQIVEGFGKDLADFLNADQSYFSLSITNLLFFRRNVMLYFPIPELGKYLPMSSSYFPAVSAGYVIKF